MPVPVLHGSQTIYGFRFGAAAYLTDHSEIPESSLEHAAAGWTCCFWTRCATSRTPRIPRWSARIATVERLAPRRAFFTHICHDLGHERAESLLPPHIRLAYDGLEIQVAGRAVGMQVYRSLDEVPADFGPSALTIGNFDGVHFGHRRILRRVKELADGARLEAIGAHLRSASHARGGAGARAAADDLARAARRADGGGRHRAGADPAVHARAGAC